MATGRQTSLLGIKVVSFTFIQAFRVKGQTTIALDICFLICNSGWANRRAASVSAMGRRTIDASES